MSPTAATSNGMNNSKSHGISNRRRRTSSSRNQQQRQEGRTTTDILGLLGQAQYKTRRNSSIIKTTDVSLLLLLLVVVAVLLQRTRSFRYRQTKAKTRKFLCRWRRSVLHFVPSYQQFVCQRMGCLLTHSFQLLSFYFFACGDILLVSPLALF